MSLLQVADRIGKMGEPLVVRLDEGIGNVVLHVQEASKPRERVRPDAEPRPFTKQRLLTEATENCFVRSRIEDVSALSASVYDQLEGSNGAVRLGLHTFEKATSWFTKPVLENLTRISEPLVSGIDSKIGGTVNSLQESFVLPARKLNENNELTVGSLVQVARDSAWVRFDEALRRIQSSMSSSSSCESDAERENLILRMRDAIQIGLIQYAEDIISRANETSLASNSRAQLRLAIDTASQRLVSLKQSLGPHYDRAKESLSSHAISDKIRGIVQRSRDAGQQAIQTTRGVTDILLENVGDAFGKTRNLTESTLVYLDSQSIAVIPKDVLEFASKALGWSERDNQYNDIADQFRELFESLSKVFMLSQDKSNGSA